MTIPDNNNNSYGNRSYVNYAYSSPNPMDRVINSFMSDIVFKKELSSLSELLADKGALSVVLSQLSKFVTDGISKLKQDSTLADLLTLDFQRQVSQELVTYFFQLLRSKTVF